MYYAILIYGVEGVVERLPEEEQERLLDDHRALQAELAEQGKLGPTVKLMATSAAVTLRHKGQGVLALDGPFAESKEQFLGFYVIECGSMAEAIEAAKKLPLEVATLEIRPIEWMRGGTMVTDA